MSILKVAMPFVTKIEAHAAERGCGVRLERAAILKALSVRKAVISKSEESGRNILFYVC